MRAALDDRTHFARMCHRNLELGTQNRRLAARLFPPSRLVTFFAQAAVDELLVGELRRFRSEHPSQKRTHEARDYAANCARCGTLGGVTKDRASGATRRRADDTTRRRIGDHSRTFPALLHCYSRQCDTVVDIPLRPFRSRTH